jgi:hypothetical protein
MVVFIGTRTGRIAVCVCGLAITEWDWGNRTRSWSHDTTSDRPDLCPGWRVATPVEDSIEEQ